MRRFTQDSKHGQRRQPCIAGMRRNTMNTDEIVMLETDRNRQVPPKSFNSIPRNRRSEYDAVIIGSGPNGLSAAIALSLIHI